MFGLLTVDKWFGEPPFNNILQTKLSIWKILGTGLKRKKSISHFASMWNPLLDKGNWEICAT